MAEAEPVQEKVRFKGKHKLPGKPDSNDPNCTIDFWKMPEFKPGDMTAPLAEESSFTTLFPQYREKYLQEVCNNHVIFMYRYGHMSQLH